MMQSNTCCGPEACRRSQWTVVRPLHDLCCASVSPQRPGKVSGTFHAYYLQSSLSYSCSLNMKSFLFWESFTPTKANSKLTKDPINLHQRRFLFCASISPLSSFNDAGGPARPWAAAEGAARWVASSTPPEQVFHWNNSHFKNDIQQIWIS